MGPLAPCNHFSELALLPSVAQLPACVHHPCPNRPLPVLAGRSNNHLLSPDRASVSIRSGLKPSWGQAGRGWKQARWPVGTHPGCRLSPLGPLRPACPPLLPPPPPLLLLLGPHPLGHSAGPGLGCWQEGGRALAGATAQGESWPLTVRRCLLAHLAAQKEKGGGGVAEGESAGIWGPPPR